MAEYEVEDWQVAYDAAKTQEEREKAIRDYQDAKLRNAARKEEEMLNRPGMIDIFLKGIDKLKEMIAKKRTNNKNKQGLQKTR